MNWLEWIFIFPFGAAAVAFFFPAVSGWTLKRLAFLASLVPLALLIAAGEQLSGASLRAAWFPALGIEFHLSVDPLAHFFLYLTAVLIPVAVMAAPRGLSHPNFFYGLVLLLQGLLTGFFAAKDLILFIILWEAMLLPVYFLMGTWGGANRKGAALKFLIYMIAGSVFLVVAALALYFEAKAKLGVGTFDLAELAKVAGTSPKAVWIFGAFVLAFAVKTPLFPFHAWLPDAYTQASTPGSIVLSAILSKAGIFGFLRIAAELFPSLWVEWTPLLLGLAIAGVLYGGLAACTQKDFKRLIAYSSFSHVNFILAGLFVAQNVAFSGALLQAFNHAVTIAGLFLVAGWLENRVGTTAFGESSGLAKFMPGLAWLTLVFVLSSVALPGTNNFVGEIMIFFGLFQENRWLAALLGLTVILSVVYSLRWMQKMFFEAPKPFQTSWSDIQAKEYLSALPLVALILWVGIYPAPVLKMIPASAVKSVPAAAIKPGKPQPAGIRPAPVKTEPAPKPVRPGRRK